MHMNLKRFLTMVRQIKFDNKRLAFVFLAF